MLGAIAGDVIGSAWEGTGAKRLDFPLLTEHSRLTDDTVMTVAIARALLTDRDYAASMRELGRRHPDAGYGARFRAWLLAPGPHPNDSWGNGSAMRVTPIGFAAADEAEALAEARRSAEPTHAHPDAVRAAQAVALGIFRLRQGASPDDLRRELAERFGYDLDRTVEAIRPGYRFDVSAAGSVPEAIVCFLDAPDFETAVRNAVSLGGDADTQACIAGALAEARFGAVPGAIAREVRSRLPADLLAIVDDFSARFPTEG